MSERFFLETPPRDGRAALTGDEARHLTRVLRAKVGDEIVVFDGVGTAWPARVVGLGRDRVDLATGAAEVAPPRRGPVVTLAVALPKGERQKWLVEKLTELGVDRLVPLETTRGVAEATPSARARLERGVIEACKQCGRTRLMTIAPPRPVADLVATLPAEGHTLIAEPGAPSFNASGIAASVSTLLALVGPEGGFTDAEIAAAEQAGAVRVGLGPHILRIETAAITLAVRLTMRGDG
jgi:16S rRNA (uracil1498-N3)-methyltransferase